MARWFSGLLVALMVVVVLPTAALADDVPTDPTVTPSAVTTTPAADPSPDAAVTPDDAMPTPSEIPSVVAATEPAVSVLLTYPILFEFYGPPPHGDPSGGPSLPNPIPVPTMSLDARLTAGTPLGGPAGEPVIFTVGPKPTAAKPTAGIVICRATTMPGGLANCDSGKLGMALILSTLALGAWAVHPATSGYGFTVSRVPLVGQACDNPFC